MNLKKWQHRCNEKELFDVGGELGGLMEGLILSLNDFPNGNSASNSVTEVNRRQVPSTAALIYRLLKEK